MVGKREHDLRLSLQRLVEAIQAQMLATGLPKPLAEVARGVVKEHPYVLERIDDLERIVRKQHADAEHAAKVAQNMRNQIETLHQKQTSFDADWKSLRDENTSLRVELDAARANIGTLDVSLQTARGLADREVNTSDARLAHIRVLERFLSDHEEEDGIFIPRAEFVKPYKGR